MSKIYIIDYNLLWIKIVYSDQPFNYYDHYVQTVLPFNPELLITIHNANDSLFNTLITMLSYVCKTNVNTFNNDKYLFVPYLTNVLNVLVNFDLSNRSFEPIVFGFVKTNNTGLVEVINNNMLEKQTVIPNTSSLQTIVNSNKLPIDKLEHIKSVNMALFVWLDKCITINPNKYTVKKDAFNHYKTFAKSQLLPELKLQEFYSIINSIGFQDVRKDDNSVFDSMEITCE
jgi:hypothetical protein